MPTYHYRCAECAEEFELWQSIHDDALTRHPGCGGSVTRVFAPAGIVLKGSGFYRTDSRAGAGKSTRDSKEKERAGVSGNGSGSDGKGSSDAKAPAGSKDASSDSKPSHDGKGSKGDTSKHRTGST